MFGEERRGRKLGLWCAAQETGRYVPIERVKDPSKAFSVLPVPRIPGVDVAGNLPLVLGALICSFLKGERKER